MEDFLSNTRTRCKALFPLKNHYLLVRHHHARSNDANILVSSRRTDQCYPGLTAQGQIGMQVSSIALASELRKTAPNLPIKVLTSTLSRARESAEIVVRTLTTESFGQVSLQEEARLNDRGYGVLDGEPAGRWEELRSSDIAVPFSSPFGAESVAALVQRASDLLTTCEGHAGMLFIMMTHCDVIQIFNHICADTSHQHYSEHRHLGYGEWQWLAAPQT